MLLHTYLFWQITKRGDNVEEKIKKLDAELARYKEQIKKTRPGPAQEAVKARAMRVLKQKRMYKVFRVFVVYVIYIVYCLRASLYGGKKRTYLVLLSSVRA